VDDLAFLFERNPARPPDDFVQHYLQDHARMGRTWVKGVARYAVSLRDLDQSPLQGRTPGPATAPVDALTELTVDDVAAFFDPARSFDDPEHATALLADHDTMFGAQQHCYRVQRRVVVGGDQDWPTLARTPGVKLLCLVGAADAGGGAHAEPGEAGVWRSATSTVLEVVSRGAPPLRALVERQFREPADLDRFLDAAPAGAVPAESFLLSEYLQLP
jgi:hypothetical protein